VKEDNAIETRDLSKKYDDLLAVDSIALSIKKGGIFGLLGPNGAGKTTLISMLVTMRKPTSGSASVNGFDISKESDSVRRSIGIVFQDPSLDDELTAIENLRLHASMYGMSKQLSEKRISELLRIVGLEDKSRIQVKKFSGGMKRRLEIARGLIHHPKVLFLDEPTLGLDPQTRASIWGYIQKLNKSEGITIVLTTHYMDEADKVCHDLAIIDKGKIVVIGTPKSLKDGLGGDVVSVKCSDGTLCADELSKFDWVKSAITHDGFVDVRVEKGEEKIPRLMKVIGDSGVKVNSISLRKPSLDDVFLHYTGSTIREQEGTGRDAMRLRRKAWGRR